jgi:DNA uptake protein ComE-like DNA-binding protein
VGSCGVTWALRENGMIVPGYEQIPGIGEETAKAIMAYEPPAPWSVEWLLQIPGIGPKMAERLFAAGEQGLGAVPGLGPAKQQAVQDFAVPPMTGWGDLTQIKGIGQATAEAIQAFVSAQDPFGIWKARRFAQRVRDAGLPGVPEPTHTSAELAEGDGRCCWAGLVKKIIYRDLAEDERAAGNPGLEGIRAPTMTRSVTLVCTDDGEDDVHLRIDRFQYRAFARKVASITPGSDGVVVTGRIVKGFGTAIRVSKLWIIEP